MAKIKDRPSKLFTNFVTRVEREVLRVSLLDLPPADGLEVNQAIYLVKINISHLINCSKAPFIRPTL